MTNDDHIPIAAVLLACVGAAMVVGSASLDLLGGAVHRLVPAATSAGAD